MCSAGGWAQCSPRHLKTVVVDVCGTGRRAWGLHHSRRPGTQGPRSARGHWCQHVLRVCLGPSSPAGAGRVTLRSGMPASQGPMLVSPPSVSAGWASGCCSSCDVLVGRAAAPSREAVCAERPPASDCCPGLCTALWGRGGVGLRVGDSEERAGQSRGLLGTEQPVELGSWTAALLVCTWRRLAAALPTGPVSGAGRVSGCVQVYDIAFHRGPGPSS